MFVVFDYILLLLLYDFKCYKRYTLQRALLTVLSVVYPYFFFFLHKHVEVKSRKSTITVCKTSGIGKRGGTLEARAWGAASSHVRRRRRRNAHVVDLRHYQGRTPDEPNLPLTTGACLSPARPGPPNTITVSRLPPAQPSPITTTTPPANTSARPFRSGGPVRGTRRPLPNPTVIRLSARGLRERGSCRGETTVFIHKKCNISIGLKHFLILVQNIIKLMFKKIYTYDYNISNVFLPWLLRVRYVFTGFDRGHHRVTGYL